MIFGCGLLWLINRTNLNYRKGFFIMLFAFATTSPYLIYTYHLTGRLFYWGNSGGWSLYWMSTPFKGEYGDCWEGELPACHQKDIVEISKFKGVEQDDALKRIAYHNIKTHPLKFVQNWISNIGRLFFNFPYSSASVAYSGVGNPLRSLLMFPINAIVFLFTIFSFCITLINWKKISYYVLFLMCFVFLYLGASSLGSAYSRQFYIIVPVLLFWFAYVMNKTVTVVFKFAKHA